jgi:hypothetical protein
MIYGCTTISKLVLLDASILYIGSLVEGLERSSCTEKSSGISITYLSTIYTFLIATLDDDSGIGNDEAIGMTVGAEVSDGIGIAVTSGAQAFSINIIIKRVRVKVVFIVFSLQVITNSE